MRARSGAGLLLAGVVLASLLLRAPIAAVSPALEWITLDLGLSQSSAGLVTTLPLVCFSVFAFVTPALTRRFGVMLTFWIAMLVLLAGIVVRSMAPVSVVFFGGVTLIGLGIAIGNVAVPAIVRQGFKDRARTMLIVYSIVIQIGATLGAAATVPLMQLGWGWPRALDVWAWPAVLVLVVWWLAMRSGHGASLRADSPVATSIATLVRRTDVWAVTAVMGLQAMTFYALLTWLPQLLRDQGVSPASAGVLLGAFTLSGLVGSALVGRILAAAPTAGLWVLLGLNLVSYGLLVVGAGGWVAALGSALSGVCAGAWLSIGLWCIARQDDPADVPGVSALAQGLGYLLAAAGPVAAGVLVEFARAWWLPMLVMALAMVAATLAAVWLTRPSTA